MASRRDIKSQFYSDVVALFNTIIPESNIGIRGEPDGLPAVAYTTMVRPKTVNDATTAVPYDYTYDSNGDKTTAHYPSFYVGRFDIQMQADENTDAESYFESLIDEFRKYDDGWLHPSDFHPDCRDIAVVDNRDADDLSSEDSVRGDYISLEVTYVKWLDRDGEPITTIHQTIDADTDSGTTNGNTYDTT